MKSFLLAALVLGAAIAPASAFDAYQKPDYAASALPSLALRAVEVAQQELHKVKPDWQNYQVQAAQTPAALIVMMWQPKGSAAQPAVASDKDPTNLVVVVLDRDTLKVTDVRQGHI